MVVKEMYNYIWKERFYVDNSEKNLVSDAESTHSVLGT